MVPTTTHTAPSLFLPPLGRLHAHPMELISSALQAMRRLYFPVIPSTTVYKQSGLFFPPNRNIEHSIHDNSVPDSGYASAEESDEEVGNAILDSDTHTQKECSNLITESDSDADIIRADPIERAFAIKWVTGFVARSDTWISYAESDIATQERTDTLDEATNLLSAFIGGDDEDEVALTRTFSFTMRTQSDSAEDESPIQVELNDAPLSKEDHTSVGLQSWGSSIILAERFCLQPSFFSLVPRNQHQETPLRILELGAGTGMLSIVASKILQSTSSSSPNVEVVATDYHPDVLDNLSKNIDTNFPSGMRSSSISVIVLDWENPIYESPFDRAFDIILAADVIYHPCHAQWIKQCVERLLARPQDQSVADAGGVFWLIIPVRTTGRHEGMDGTVETLFPEVTSHVSTTGDMKLAILHREVVGRQGGVGRADEGAYKLFKIGWVC